MGLDGVELVMAVEEAFGIEITDEEAGKAVNVGDLYDLVLAKLSGEDTKRCLTSAAFYRTRRGFVDGLRINRREIGPDTLLGTILPREHRRQKWLRVQSATSVEISDLELPAWLQSSFIVVGLFLSIALVSLAYIRLGLHFGLGSGLGLALAGILTFALLVSLLSRLSRPMAIEFPHQAVTIGDLAKNVLARNHAQLAAAAGGWNKKEVWEALCRVIVNKTGVAPEKIKPEARFVKDLGVD